MRFIVYGAGAVGGVVGGRLAQNGNDVVLIARGAHAEAMQRSGLTLESPDGTSTVDVRVVTHPSEVDIGADDVVVLAMKSQDTHDALLALRSGAASSTPVVCLQNGVANERAALRLFEHVYGINVMCPAGHLEPGVVQAYSSPVSGILDVGRFPSGSDETAEQIAAALGGATFVSEVRDDIMRWKYAKLLMNLGNAVQALYGRAAARGPIGELVRAEGRACLAAAGIEFVSVEEDRERRGDLLHVRPIGETERPGGSSWQSLERRTGAIESDYLNGEIVLLGRLHGVPTPANELLQQLAAEAAAARAAPGSLAEESFLERLGLAGRPVPKTGAPSHNGRRMPSEPADPRVRELANLVVERCLDVQPGWQVSVRATPLARPFVQELARAIARRGAYFLPRINWGPDRFRLDFDWALEAPLELLEELPAIERYAVETENARLTVRAPEDLQAGADLPAERRALLQKALEPASRRARALDVRWAIVQYPTEASAAAAGMTLAEYEDFVYRACLLDWDAEEQRMLRIKERFDAASSIRILGYETDLTLSVSGRAGVISSGLRNMPDGEVFYCPVEDSADGVITFSEFPAVYLGQDAERARLVFREGRIVEATAASGEEFLRQMIATDEGASRLGEVGLGCNRRITRFTHNVLFDEKIDGTVHLALGASYTYAGGRNESAIHWDLVKDLRPAGELYADGELVQRDGTWLI